MSNSYIKFLFNKENEDESGLYSFLDIFKKLKYDKINIPVFQRNYSWDDENLNDFTDDFDEYFKIFNKDPSKDFPKINDDTDEAEEILASKRVPITFFGSMYIYENHDEHSNDIIDGQQRIATFFIFLLAQWHLFKKNENEIKKAIVDSAIKDKDKEKLLNILNFYRRNLKKILFEQKAINYSDKVLYNYSKLNTENLNDNQAWVELLKIATNNENNFEEDLENYPSFHEYLKKAKQNIKTRNYNPKDSKNYELILNSKIFYAFGYAYEYFIKLINDAEENEWFNVEYLENVNNKWFAFFIYSFLFTFDFSKYFQVGIFEIISPKYMPNIFENINAKAKQLASFDLLKNMVFTKIQSKDEKIKTEFAQKIEEIEKLIKNTYGDITSTDYMLDIFKSMYLKNEKNLASVNKEKIFEKFEGLLYDELYKNNPLKLLDDIKKYLENYEYMFPKGLYGWSINENENNDFLENYNTYKIVGLFNYKILKAMLVGMTTLIDLNFDGEVYKNQKTEKDNVNIFMKRLAIIYFINMSNNKKANWHDIKLREIMKAYSKKQKITSLINEFQDSSDEDLKNFIQSIMDKDKFIIKVNDFIKKVSEDSDKSIFEDNNVVKAILQDIYFNEATVKREFLNIKYELEHILPVKPSFSKDDFSDYDSLKYNIGNMMLLKKKTNAKLGNAPFEQKMEKIYNEKEYIEILIEIDDNIFDNQSIKKIGDGSRNFTENEISKRNRIILEKLLNKKYADFQKY